MSTTNRVIKNTGYLYLKMCITMFLSLFTTRIVLKSLGPSDYGIFNVIAGTIAMLGFLNSTLAYATQRFMTYAEGEGNYNKQCKIFNISLVLHALIALVTALFQLGLMHPLFNGVLNIADGREFAARIVYLSMIFSTVITIVNATYDAVMNAHENMRFYSFMGVLDALMRFFIAIACIYTTSDKLMFYGILMSIVPIITFIITQTYCHKNYSECKISPRKYWDLNLVKEIASFSVWNFLTAISSLFSVQGGGLILNHFFGSKLNAAQGIAVQLNGYLSAFATNMLKAINPVIVKNAGAQEMSSMNIVTILGAKYSTFLIMLFAVPCILEMKMLLHIWLDTVPEWTLLFCVLQIIQAVILQMGAPISTSVYAQGNIKYYSIWKSIVNLLPLFLTYMMFKYGAAPYWLYILMIAFYAIAGNGVILYYAKKYCELSVGYYFRSVCIPVFLTLITMFIFGVLPSLIIKETFLRVCMTAFFSIIGLLIACITYAMEPFEKEYLKSIAVKTYNRFVKHKN